VALARRSLLGGAGARKLLGGVHRPQPPLPIQREVLAVTQELQSGTSLRESLRWMDMPELWVVVLVLVPVLALIAWIGYAREPISSPWRYALAGLRFASLAALLLVLFRPVMVERREEVRPAEVVLLIDDSASMLRKDAYSGDREMRARLEPLLDPGAELGGTTRLDLATDAMEDVLLPLLERGDYAVRSFGFAETLAPVSELEALAGRGLSTNIGDGIQQALSSHRGRHVTDIVLLSDGRSNGGGSPSEAARAAAAAGIPVHTVVVGDTRPERNVILELVEAPSNALTGDEIAVLVRVLGRGLSSGESAPVVLEELTGGVSAGEGRVVAEEEVALSESGGRVLLVAPPGSADPSTGERRFRVAVAPLGEETLLDDNELELSVHVTPEKVRVLYVEGYPRWDYRQLALNVLKRADENISFQAFLLSATPDFPQESSKHLEPLRAVPVDRQTLLEQYDVIVLGDVNPYAISPDPSRCEEFLASVYEFVERGGGLLLQAGEYDNPRAFVGTPLEDLMPIQLDSGSSYGFQGDTTVEVRPVLEDPTAPHEIIRLVADPAENRALWEEQTGLRGFYWFYPVGRAKPTSEVLLRHPTDGNANGRYPLLVVGHFPAGRTMFLAIDSTWRWRFRYADDYLERFWRNAIRWLALGRLKSGDRRFRVETPRSSYNLGERVPIEARVLDPDYRPGVDPTQTVHWQDPEGASGEEKLPLVAERAGLYRGALAAEKLGLHHVWIESEGARIASAEFEVVLPSRENSDPSPDPALMRELAVLSGGRSVQIGALQELGQEFPGGEERREPISSELEDIWDNWGTLALALALLSAEWVLRKRVELV
jgi:uncharacterized membrane protein